ncbi:MAG TPA: hypothetical protein GXX69_07845, partial [Firmicutes bacterium]|nr:hypothetical protein [Bacillota bacterium]
IPVHRKEDPITWEELPTLTGSCNIMTIEDRLLDKGDLFASMYRLGKSIAEVVLPEK